MSRRRNTLQELPHEKTVAHREQQKVMQSVEGEENHPRQTNTHGTVQEFDGCNKKRQWMPGGRPSTDPHPPSWDPSVKLDSQWNDGSFMDGGVISLRLSTAYTHYTSSEATNSRRMEMVFPTRAARRRWTSIRRTCCFLSIDSASRILIRQMTMMFYNLDACFSSKCLMTINSLLFSGGDVPTTGAVGGDSIKATTTHHDGRSRPML